MSEEICNISTIAFIQVLCLMQEKHSDRKIVPLQNGILGRNK